MRRHTRRRTAFAPVLVLFAWVAGCSTDTPPPTPAADPTPTTLASYDTASVNVVRGPFCDRISPTGIEHALGDVPADSETWENGDRERLPDGSRDRVHEYGCRWTAADSTQASAWVFAPPVTLPEARVLTRDLTRDAFGADCRAVPDAADFGAPGASAICVLDTGNTVVERAGRFGDAWLTCTVSAAGAPDDLAARASEWCVQVVEATRG